MTPRRRSEKERGEGLLGALAREIRNVTSPSRDTFHGTDTVGQKMNQRENGHAIVHDFYLQIVRSRVRAETR